MKKLIPICLLIVIAFSVKAPAQNAPLNKQQTLDYIEKLFRANYESSDNLKITEFKLDGKILSWKSNVAGIRTDLSAATSLEIDLLGTPLNPNYQIFYKKENNDKVNVLTWIRVESDAKRLKKALEHLIDIVKTEKSTDPFEN
jgi:hypothetical protein